MTAPLVWPPGVARAPHRRRSPYRVKSFDAVRSGVIYQLEMIGGCCQILISSNLGVNARGQRLADAPEPRDPGVAVYWTKLHHDRPPQSFVIACDRWDRVVHNLREIEHRLEEQRALERRGCTFLELTEVAA